MGLTYPEIPDNTRSTMTRHHHSTRPKADLTLVISIAMIMLTTLGSTVPLYIHISNSTHEQLQGIREEISGMREEMRDFHGRLCAIEERNKKG